MNKNSAKYKQIEAEKAAKEKKAKSASERLESSKRGSGLWVGIAIAAVVLLAIGGAAWLKFFKGEDQPEHEAIQPVSEQVEIATAKLSDGKVHFFSTQADGVTVKYMAAKDRDGVLRTAFNACDVCYAQKKGYSDLGDSVKCLNCGKTFPIKDLGVTNKAGGCEPGYLAHSKTGTGIAIKLSDLEKGVRYFE
jgi:uncharacterized membrane protein